MYANGSNFIEELKMYQLLKKQNNLDREIIHNSIFNRYNSFQNRKSKFPQQEADQVLKAFYNFFGGNILFNFFLLSKRARQAYRKVSYKTSSNLDHFKKFKSKAIWKLPTW